MSACQRRRTTSRRQEVEAFTSKVDHTINRAIPSCVQHCMAAYYHVIAMLNRVHFWCSGKILQTCLEIAKTEVSKATNLEYVCLITVSRWACTYDRKYHRITNVMYLPFRYESHTDKWPTSYCIVISLYRVFQGNLIHIFVQNIDLNKE